MEAENIKSEPAPIGRKLIPKRIVDEKSPLHSLTRDREQNGPEQTPERPTDRPGIGRNRKREGTVK